MWQCRTPFFCQTDFYRKYWKLIFEKNIDQCATDCRLSCYEFCISAPAKTSRKKAGARERGPIRSFSCLKLWRYKVAASVNKTVQTYQRGDFSARHVTSLQTTPQGANVRERAPNTSPSPMQHITVHKCTYVCKVKMCPLEQYEYAGRLSKFQVPQFAEFEKKPIEAAPYISHLSPVRNWIFNMIFCLAAQIVFSFKFIPLGISPIIIMI